jgi:SPW repeat
VTPELPEERNHGAVDGVMLLTGVCVAVASWSELASVSTTPPWKFYSGVGLTLFLALAGLTRRARWADAMRFLMGLWTITAPFLLGLAMRDSVLLTCLIMGGLLTVLSVPGIIREKGLNFLRQVGARRVLSLPP